MTLRQWLRDASVTYKIDANLRGMVFQLERHCYVTNLAAKNFPEFKSTMLQNLTRLLLNRLGARQSFKRSVPMSVS